jgi:hypothetical protein
MNSQNTNDFEGRWVPFCEKGGVPSLSERQWNDPTRTSLRL